MKKVIAFGASNSSRSINKQFAEWAAERSGLTSQVLDLNDFEMPIFSIDREENSGFPEEASKFKNYVRESDGIIISFAEHNGAYSAAFKNIMDWVSRLEKAIWNNKPMLLLATSPGGRGASTVLDIAVNSFPHRGGNVVASFSLPSFSKNFDTIEGITEPELRESFDTKLMQFKSVVQST